jgi:hypothetical protein
MAVPSSLLSSKLACQQRRLHLFVLPPSSSKLNGVVERVNRTHTEEFYQVAPLLAGNAKNLIANSANGKNLQHRPPSSGARLLNPARSSCGKSHPHERNESVTRLPDEYTLLRGNEQTDIVFNTRGGVRRPVLIAPSEGHLG